ncbi:MAG TPA: hypothetical protein VK519_15805 [Pinirhizobacter sp.]|uniref:hypothetical protein n=1 Tax=Pinirhizobacter sp. TaxID=2950432 RepID=UPI002BDDD4B6|nr:hypothetical protein [Pinirhizobacter sp.]HMH69376.1 hypothetical protein [Pinirhizobacter sp.]
MQTLTLEQLRTASLAGGVETVTLTAKGASFFVQVGTRNGSEALLAKARSTEPRRFGNPLQALVLLRGLGLFVGGFDVGEWDPADKGTARTRPDRAEALRRTHAAAEHDRWFRQQVADALLDVENSSIEAIPHEEVRKNMQRQRERIKALIASKE